jgi:hypothetical protein
MVYHVEILLLFLVLVVIGPLVSNAEGFSEPDQKKFGLASFPS